MAFVPRYIYDVFLSYAHLDERTPDRRPGWVSGFNDELQVALSQQLGEEAMIWFDRERLEPGYRLPEKVRYDLSRTAVLLRLESPSFWQSDYCKFESELFKVPREPLDDLHVAQRSRILRAELLPTPDPEVQYGSEILALLHTFKRRVEPDHAASMLAPHIAVILREMEGARESVYIPRPSIEDAESFQVWSNTIDELKSLNYRFTPRTVAPETQSQIRNAIDRAQLSVVLIGANAIPDEVKLRIEIAAERARPIVWVSPIVSSAGKDTPQAALLAWLLAHAERYDLLQHAGVEKLKEQMRGRLARDFTPPLKALREVLAETPAVTGAPKIYLICDPRDRKKGAWRVKEMVETSGFEVLLPEIAAPDAKTLSLDHLRKVRSADAVLLYYHSASRKWFEQHWRDLCDDALPWRRRGACLVDPPDKRRWVEDAKKRGYETVSSDKVLVTGDSPESLTPFLTAIASARNAVS